MGKKQKKTVVAEPVMPPSPAKEYYTPQLNKILTKLSVDSSIYKPEKVGNYLALRANLPEPLRFSHRTTVKIDCGINLEIPPTWILKAVANEYFTNRGFLLLPTPVKDGRIVLTGINIGKELLVINPQEVFALLYAEPVYFFDWGI